MPPSAQRLGLRTPQVNDHTDIIQPLLTLLTKFSMDFHATFRHLTAFRPSWMTGPASSRNPETQTVDPLDSFLQTVLPSQSVDTSKPLDVTVATKDWLEFLHRYAERINQPEEKAAWQAYSMKKDPSELSQSVTEKQWEAARENWTKQFNPRFVLRQWVLEDIIGRLQTEAQTAKERDLDVPTEGRRALAKILEMCTQPYTGWGAEGLSGEALSDVEKEERRLCGTGPQKLLGFQCSCSS